MHNYVYVVLAYVAGINIWISSVDSATSLFKRMERVDEDQEHNFMFSKNVQDVEQKSENILKEFGTNIFSESSLKKNLGDMKNDLDLPNIPNDATRRQKRSTNTRKPIDLYPPVDLKDPNLHLIVHWAGMDSDILVILTKNVSYNSHTTSSNVYFSYNYGKTFIRKIQSASGNTTNKLSVPRGLISNFYSTKLDINRYIFSDKKNKVLFTTIDAGRNIRKVSVSFNPDKLSIHPTKPSVILALDKTSADKGLYKSEDFGYSWTKIQIKVKAFYWGYKGAIQYDKQDSLYVERIEPGGGISVLRTETYFRDTYDQVLISNVEDFVIMNNSMFATRKQASGSNRDLWIAVTRRSRFARANFHTSLSTKEFYVVDASDSQIMVCVNHAFGQTNLYISEPNQIDFVLSLENITYFNPKTQFTTLSLFATERFADIHKVSGMRSIFIANVMNNSRHMFGFGYDVSSMHTVITFNKGSLWERLAAPEYNSSGYKSNCSARSGCSLHLAHEFHHVYPRSSSSLIYSQSSAPGFVLAQGNVGKNIKYESNLYFSSTAGSEWTEVLSGSWIYTWGDHGGIIVAVPKFQRTDTLWYSANQGELWNTFKFANETLNVYGLMTEPGESSAVFTVFGASAMHYHSWLLIQVNLTNIFSGQCINDDYKSWSPADERGITCLMGSQTSFQRRNKVLLLPAIRPIVHHTLGEIVLVDRLNNTCEKYVFRIKTVVGEQIVK